MKELALLCLRAANRANHIMSLTTDLTARNYWAASAATWTSRALACLEQANQDPT